MKEEETVDFLLELYHQTGGDTENQVSMHDVGAALGLDKTLSSASAEDLIMDGFVELKTLAGGIGITANGIGLLQDKGAVEDTTRNRLKLRGLPILDDTDRKTVESLLAVLKKEISGKSIDYPEIESAIIDIKTIEVHLLSSKAKTAVIKAIFSSLRDVASGIGLQESAASISEILE